jgi:Flp pilus assembly protein TadB
MLDEPEMMDRRETDENDRSESVRPLQFRLRTLFGLTAAMAALFGVLDWLGVPSEVSGVVLVVLIVSVLAALGLVVVIANSVTGEHDPDE